MYFLVHYVGNLNNHIGVPLTLLELEPQHRYAVIEMGANHLGEIEYLRNIVSPGIAVVTNTLDAHLGEFGGFENLVRTKGAHLKVQVLSFNVNLFRSVFLDRVIHFVKILGDQVKGRSPKKLKSFIEVPKVAHLKVYVLSFNMNLFSSP